MNEPFANGIGVFASRRSTWVPCSAYAGLGPLRLPNGLDDPDGDLTVTEFSAKRAITAEAAAKEEIKTDATEPLTELSVP